MSYDSLKVVSDEVEEVLRKHGVIDWAFIGIDIYGHSTLSFSFGEGLRPEDDHNEYGRGCRLVGEMEAAKAGIMPLILKHVHPPVDEGAPDAV